MGRVYATSDWHGCAQPAMKIFEYLQPDDTLYFIGDAIDRGEDGIKLMNKLLTDPRIIYLKGNHEEFMADCVPTLMEGHSGYAGNWLCGNGGEKTWDSMQHMSDESKMWYVHKIHKMPTKVVYRSPKGHAVILEHAGYSPFDMPHRSHNPLWDREHFYDEWDNGFDREKLDPEKTYLVHGHTPVQYLQFMYGYKGDHPLTKEEFIAKRQFMEGIIMDGEKPIQPKIIRYCDGHKFDIDMCTIVSGRVALLDLDTFETIYFDSDEEIE